MVLRVLQEQLIKAGEAIQHQIDVLCVVPITGRVLDGNGARHVIAMLEDQLREIDDALSSLKAEET